MDLQQSSPPGMALTNHKDKSKVATVVAIVLGVLLALSLGALAWLYMQSEADKQKLRDENAQLQSKIDTGITREEAALVPDVCSDTPTMEMMDNIRAALDTENTAVFETYVTDPVTFVLAGTEKGGQDSAAEAAQGMNYTHSATGPWDFNLSAATLASYEAGFYRDYFDETTYAGKAASGMVASFDFDCDGKIKQIFVAADDDLLLE